MFDLTLTSLQSRFFRASSAQRLRSACSVLKDSPRFLGLCRESVRSLQGGTSLCFFLVSSLPQSCISLAKDHFSGGILLPLLYYFRVFNNAKVENFEIRRIFFLFFFYKNAFFFVFE
jgi:hypothetical protein